MSQFLGTMAYVDLWEVGRAHWGQATAGQETPACPFRGARTSAVPFGGKTGTAPALPPHLPLASEKRRL
jgi:hypothetical protein